MGHPTLLRGQSISKMSHVVKRRKKKKRNKQTPFLFESTFLPGSDAFVSHRSDVERQLLKFNKKKKMLGSLTDILLVLLL